MSSLTTNVLYSEVTAATALTTKDCTIIGIFWTSDPNVHSENDIAADDDFLLSDKNGNRIISKRAEFAGDDLGITPCMPLPVSGVTVTTMDGGVCYVWIK